MSSCLIRHVTLGAAALCLIAAAPALASTGFTPTATTKHSDLSNAA